jgi:hypothetical protein
MSLILIMVILGHRMSNGMNKELKNAGKRKDRKKKKRLKEIYEIQKKLILPLNNRELFLA